MVPVEEVQAGDETIGLLTDAHGDVTGFKSDRYVDDGEQAVLAHCLGLVRFVLAELRISTAQLSASIVSDSPCF